MKRREAKPTRNSVQISVIGGSNPDRELLPLATEVGRTVAACGAVLVCGGLGGIMQAAAAGAKERGGLTVGILPDYKKNSANAFIDVAIPTGLGHARNILVAAAGDVVVALPGSYGTLSEIAFALQLGRPVIAVRAWKDVAGVRYVNSVEELAMELVPYF